MATKKKEAPSEPKKLTLGASIDAIFKLREKRKKLEAAAQEIERLEAMAKEALLTEFGAEQVSAARGKYCTATVTEKIVPARTVDWEKLHAHILKTGDFDLLHKRVGEAACTARWDDGVDVPGVEKFKKITVTLTGR